MPPFPLAPINEEGSWLPLKEDKKMSSSCNVSVATSSGSCIDDPDFNFDPDAVDFEPLLVSGTGKILSYHSEDHIQLYRSGSYDDDEDVSTTGASTVVTSASADTRIAGNSSSRKRTTRRQEDNTNNGYSWSFPQMVRIATILSLVTFVSIRLLSRPGSSTNYQMQTTVAKTKSSHATSLLANSAVIPEAAIESSYAANQPLFEAVKSNNIDLTRMLLDGVSTTAKETNNNYDINCEDPQGMTPLIEATLIGNIELVKLLLSHGARAQPLPGFLHTPLRAACLTANLDLIRLLLDEGADPNSQSEGGRTPLMGACYLRPQFDALPNRDELSFAAVRLMLSDPRTAPEIRNLFGESALDLCQGRKYDKSTMLLRRAIREKRGEKRLEFKQKQG